MRGAQDCVQKSGSDLRSESSEKQRPFPIWKERQFPKNSSFVSPQANNRRNEPIRAAAVFDGTMENREWVLFSDFSTGRGLDRPLHGDNGELLRLRGNDI